MREFRLDVGEAESILMAKGLDAVCATDDGPAIRCCKVLGVPFVTAIGFLVALAEAGELGDGLASELPAELERHGRYHPRILEDAALRIAAATRRGGRS
jgi:predicted nucleic acid-binding protein